MPAEKALYWTDVPAYTVHRWTPDTGEQRSWRMPEMVTSMSLRAQGGLILATSGRINRWDPDSDRLETLAVPEADLPDNRSNDGKCDRRGRFWYGTMQNNLNPDGSSRPMTESSGNLWRIDGDGSFHCMDSGIGISNTFAWSPDNRVMYFGDTLAGIHAYDFDIEAGAIANRRLFAKTRTGTRCPRRFDHRRRGVPLERAMGRRVPVALGARRHHRPQGRAALPARDQRDLRGRGSRRPVRNDSAIRPERG